MSAWPRVKLGEVLRRRPLDVTVDAGEEYDFAGVYSFGRGVFRREPRCGAQFSYRQLTRLEAGNFVYPKLMAWEGAFGLVPPECDGCCVSPEFPVFEVNPERLMPEFLGHYFRIPRVWEEVSGGSTGTNVRRRRLNPEDFLKREIPLPPLAEQRRVVARIEELAAQIQEARTLRQQATEEADAIWERGASRIFDRAVEEFPIRPLTDLVTTRGGGTPSKSDPSYWTGSIPWISPKDMKIRELVDAHDHISERATVETAARLLEPECVLVVVRGMILAHTFPSAVLRRPAAINQGMKALIPSATILPEYLCSMLWAYNSRILELVEKSTHDTRKLETQKLLATKIPVPPLPEQRRIVAELDALQAQVDALKRLQAETAAELDALLPAILDRAFNGELLPQESVALGLSAYPAPEETVPLLVAAEEAAPYTASASPKVPVAPPSPPPATPPRKKLNQHFARAVLSAEIVHRLHAEPTFGRVKHQKIFHLCEHIARIEEIAGQYHREAAGPLDNRAIYANEAELRKQQWYREVSRDSHGHAYRPLPKAGGHEKYLPSFSDEQVGTIRRLIELMRTWETDRCEIFCTAYAAWNDLLLWKREPTEEAILHEILERWNPAKRRFPITRWQAAIHWMREHEFVPVGFGAATAAPPAQRP